MKKVLDKYCGFEHATVIKRLPVESLEDGCYMSILFLFVTICV